MHICHVITGLQQGGAESTLARILPGLAARGLQGSVISLTGTGALTDTLRKAGVEPQFCDLRGRRLPGGLRVLRTLLRRSSCDLVQTWMYHADLFGGIAAKSLSIPVVWNLRRSDPDTTLKRSTRLIVRACSQLSSRLPQAVIAGSDAAWEAHRRIGYNPERIQVIPNGIDLNYWRPDPSSGVKLRRSLGIADDMPVVGLVGRLHPVKGHEAFISAAGRLHRQGRAIACILCGEGVEPEAESLQGWLQQAGPGLDVHLLGLRRDLPCIYSALDLLVNCSRTEGFPNVVAEAMACETPCLVTDVGDSRIIIGDTGFVLDDGEPAEIASGIASFLSLSRAERLARGEAARQRIAERFGFEKMIERYAALYESLLPGDKFYAA